jgi:hypothetical protein
MQLQDNKSGKADGSLNRERGRLVRLFVSEATQTVKSGMPISSFLLMRNYWEDLANKEFCRSL